MGYIVGSKTAAVAGSWRYGLRVTPFMGAVAVALIIWVMRDPERGEAEESHMKPTTYQDDLRSLVRKWVLFNSIIIWINTQVVIAITFIIGFI